MATSGMPMPALSASRFTVSTSQRCVSPSVPAMTFALVDIFAMNFDSSSEMIAPVKPTTAENASSGPMPPWVASAWSMPGPGGRWT